MGFFPVYETWIEDYRFLLFGVLLLDSALDVHKQTSE